MTFDNVQKMVESTDSIVDTLRESPVGSFEFPVVEDEYTHWIEEQRAWRETVALADQSYHMTGLHVEGPDAVDLFRDLDISSYEGFEPGQAKQFMPCNPDGYTIGDGILFHLDENKLVLIGAPIAPNYAQFHAETGDYDVTWERQGSALELDEGEQPAYFRFEVQGPNALDVIDEVTEDPLPDTSFFHFDELSIAGRDVKALRHSMSGEAGFELFGSFEDGDTVKDEIMAAGEDYGIRHLGTRTYRSSAPLSGWVEFQLPAIYDHEALQEYREWLAGESLEANCSIGGSYHSEDISDYYLSPVDLGHKDQLDFSRDFIGREALERQVEDPDRTKVSLFWDKEDVVDIFASLFEEGETYKSIDLLDPSWSVAHYDEVLKDGETVGVSKWPTYTYNERTLLSLASIDVEHSEPGTNVTIIWGEKNSPKPHVERHVQTDIRATVGPKFPTGDRR